MPKKLSQVIAIEQDLRKSTARTLTDAYHALQKPVMLDGQQRDYQPLVDGGELLPSEVQRVQATVGDMIEATRDGLAKLFDATAARDFTNSSGQVKADVRVDGTVLIADAPMPYLLWLEKQLEDLATFAGKLPVHDPSTEWVLEEARGVYAALPVQTTRVVQIPRANVIVPATERHPAQVQTYNENQVVGTWTTVKKTGSIPLSERAGIVQRIQALHRAVHVAREEAKGVEATEPVIGTRVLEYIFG